MTEVNLKLGKNEVLVIEKRKPQGINYYRIGNGKMNKQSQIESVDLIKAMVEMTKPELKALSLLIDNVPWELSIETGEYYTIGLVYMPASIFASSAERLGFQKGVKILRDKDLVRKNGANNYMLNPKAVIPSKLDMAIKAWSKLASRSANV